MNKEPRSPRQYAWELIFIACAFCALIWLFWCAATDADPLMWFR